jgi:hypothetical protein
LPGALLRCGHGRPAFSAGQVLRGWLAAGRQPCSLGFSEFEYLLGQASLPGSFSSSLRGMRSVLIHGLHDERAQQECLYVLMGAATSRPNRRARRFAC